MWLLDVLPSIPIIEKAIYNYINLGPLPIYKDTQNIFAWFSYTLIFQKWKHLGNQGNIVLRVQHFFKSWGFFFYIPSLMTMRSVSHAVSCVSVAVTSLVILCIGSNIQPLHFVFYFSEVQAFTYWKRIFHYVLLHVIARAVRVFVFLCNFLLCM